MVHKIGSLLEKAEKLPPAKQMVYLFIRCAYTGRFLTASEENSMLVFPAVFWILQKKKFMINPISTRNFIKGIHFFSIKSCKEQDIT
jgi:hypothetical protein